MVLVRSAGRATVGIVAVVIVAATVARADVPAAEIRLRDGKFEPSELSVVAGEPFKLRVVNESSDTIEFESFGLHRERIVSPGESIEINLQALQPGSYDFFDDFHDDVRPGVIVVK